MPTEDDEKYQKYQASDFYCEREAGVERYYVSPDNPHKFHGVKIYLRG